MKAKRIRAIGKVVFLIAVLALLVLASAISLSFYYSATRSKGTSSVSTIASENDTGSLTRTTTNSSSYSSQPGSPNLFTWETPNTVDYLDPDVSYTEFGYSVLQNVYEPLLWYNGSCSSCVIPWLASNYTVSSNLKTYSFNLRKGITFADGEQLNSTAVYFSLNRLLIEDGSTPLSHGTQASFILQQLLNESLSTTLCGCSESYNSSYVNDVLNENFVIITGPQSFTIDVENPNSAVPFMLADVGSFIIAPDYVMHQDMQLWEQANSGYTLPFPHLSGNESQVAREYFMDEVSTCNSGESPKGCGTTYLDGSYSGSLAGTGPYVISSFDQSSNNIVLKSNPNYWGGPLGNKIEPRISTIDIDYVPDQQTRILDLTNAAESQEAMAADVEPDFLYDVADRSSWTLNGTLDSILPGVSLYGPYKSFYTYFDAFSTNVTDAATGQFYQFQPFADQRLRLAFADAVNMTEINSVENNGLGGVAGNLIPPGLPPQGSFNASIKPIYNFNLSASQTLMLEAMEHPINEFTFVNGSSAPVGLFNNTFGCPNLPPDGRCNSPMDRTITLTFYSGDTVDQAIFETIASAINNISSTFNMGLTVTVTPEPFGFMSTQGFSDELYMYMIGGWGDDYPWVMDFLGPMFAPGQIYPVSDGWNSTSMGILYSRAVSASSSGNISELVLTSDAMNELANEEVMYLWTFYPYSFTAMTSNTHGYYFNPSLAETPTGFYFATMY